MTQTHLRRRTAIALVVAVVLALSIAPATAAALSGADAGTTLDAVANDSDDGSLDGDLLDDGNDSDVGGLLDGDDGSDDGSDGDSASDSDGGANDSDGDSTDTLSLEHDATIEAGNETFDAGVGATVDATDGIGLSVDASSSLLETASVNGTLAIDESDEAGTDAEPNGSTATTPAGGEDGGSDDGNGLPDAEDAGAGLAIGSVLLGGGVLARRFLDGAAVAGGAGSGSPLAAALAWLRAWGWRIAALAGYQRYDGSDPLEHETRAAIHERIEAEPGVCLTELADAVDVPLSTLRYHLRILAFEDLIDSEKVRGKRRYVPANADPDALAPAMEDDATAQVLEAIAAEPDSVSGLADRLGRDPSTVSHHLQRLDEEGLVEREREGRSVVSRLADGVEPTDVVGATATPAD